MEIKDGHYGALLLKEIGEDRLKWECGSCWSWITHYYENDERSFHEYSHSSLFLADQSEYEEFCHEWDYDITGSNQSFFKFADTIETYADLGLNKSKPLSLSGCIDPTIDRFDFWGLEWIFDLMNEHVPHFRPSIPKPDFISFPGINAF